MAVFTQTVSESSAAGAHIIDGSLLLDGSYLKRTFGSSSNRKTWTWSAWVKLTKLSDNGYIFAAREDTNNRLYIKYNSDATLYGYTGNANSKQFQTTRVLRDPTNWYNIVWVWDSPNDIERDRQVIYINGERTTNAQANSYTEDFDGAINDNIEHRIGNAIHTDELFESHISEMYFLDGQALGAGYFGYNDPLTNTWRPKAFKAEGTTVNAGAVWSNYVTTSTGSFTGGYEAAKGFNTDVTDWTAPGTGSATDWLGVTTDNPFGIKCESVTLKFWATKLEINGEVVYTKNAGGDTTQTFYVSDFNTFKIYGKADGSKSALYYIKIDGVQMLDSTTQTISYGTNGFYLPFDGNTPIGEDQSGNGNNWTPVHVSGATPNIDKATGALPILNTADGGNVATSAPRPDVSPVTPPGVEGCVSFDGDADSLFLDDYSEVRFGTNNFTIEGWFYANSYNSITYPTIISKYDNSDASWIARLKSDGKFVWYAGQVGGGTNNTTSSAVLALNQWFHFAVCREGTGTNETKVYFDGTLVMSCTDSSNYDDTNDIYIGRQDSNNTNYFDGYISNIRIVNGAAVYTSDFVRPQKPLEVVSNTRLLCCQSSQYVGAAVTAPTMGGINDGTYWGGQGSSYTGNIWSDPQDSSGSGSFWPGSMFSGQTSGYANNVGPYSSGVMTIDFGRTWTGSHDFVIYGRLYQNDLYKDQSGNTLYTQGSSDSGTIMNRSFTASDVSRVVVDGVSNNGNSSFVANISVDGEVLRDPLRKIPGTTSNNPYATRSEVSDKCVLAMPLVGISSDVSHVINPENSSEKFTTDNGAVTSMEQGNFYSQSFKFDGSNDYIAVTHSSDFEMQSGDFTVEAWVYVDSHGSDKTIIGNYKTSPDWQLTLAGGASNNIFMFSMWNGSATVSAESDVLDTNWIDQWVHLCGQRTGNTLQILVDGRLAGTASFSGSAANVNASLDIGGRADSYGFMNGYIQDCRVYKGRCKYPVQSVGDFAYLPPSTESAIRADSPSGIVHSPGSKKITYGSSHFDGTGDYISIADSADWNFGSGGFTVECWIYPSTSPSQPHIVGQWSNPYSWCLQLSNDSNRNIRFLIDTASGITDMVSSTSVPLQAWSHVAVVRNGNTFTFYLNGRSCYAISNSGTLDDAASVLSIGANGAGSQPFDGFISNVRVIKGRGIYTSDFTPPTEPLKNVTGTVLLCCQDDIKATNAAVTPGALSVGNDAGATNFNPFTPSANPVTSKSGGFMTFNALDTSLGATQLLNGDLDMISNGSWNTSHARGTYALTSGKWYWECTAMNSVSHAQFGFATSTANLKETYSGGQSQNWTFYWNNGREVIDPAASSANYFGTGTMQLYPGDTMSVALDMDNGTWQFFRLGRPGAIKTLEDTDDSTTSSITELYPFSGVHSMNLSHNFGQKPFKYPPPEGFNPVCLAGLDAPSMALPNQYVDVTTYTGTGNGTVNTISAFNFKPDLLIFKEYDSSQNWPWYDALRGTSSAIRCNVNSAGSAFGDAVVKPQPGGFTISGSDTTGINGDAENILVFGWKAGGSKGTFNLDGKEVASAAAAGLSGGDYTPKACSINTKQGFSILLWDGDLTGAGTKSIPHGLSGFADAGWMIISKRYSGGTSDWWVQHSAIADGSNALKLNEYDPKTDISSDGSITNPTNTLFYGNWNSGLAANSNIVGYLWKDVRGVQKFGYYTGNNSSDGPYVELGFRPAILLIKRSASSNANWYIMNKATQQYNAVTKALETNTADGQNTSVVNYDFTSTGFKIRGTDGDINASSVVYIYAAWAHQPDSNLYGGQSNAR